ncbi:hypothetical protein U7230_07655 [Carboxydochorda subterranea]|uniref:Peptidase M61 catalytic domain-containing protein n=1 Tax=Carboxydichorda subterranea TaxID=3109565 RepID=A0ABZ1C240_9FIRM|nr:hypothetical protein [Limnochorda sp. L945t]WRP18856.1 hypothetical protein U7230_07655 [Limnochorda sp. L945t]
MGEVGRLAALTRVVLAALLLAAPQGSAAVRWQRVSEGDFAVSFTPGDETAARKMLGWAEQTRAIAGRVLQAASLPGAHIYLHPSSDWKHSPYSSYADGSSRAVHFLSPSEAPRGVDDVWYFKNLIHEYVHIAHAWVLGRKWWGYRETPSWFREALAEYASVMASTPEVKAAYRGYHDQMRRAVEASDTAFLFKGDVYAWGVFFGAFLTEQWGQDALARVVHSRARSFEASLEELTGLDAIGLERRWMEWLPTYVETVDWPGTRVGGEGGRPGEAGHSRGNGEPQRPSPGSWTAAERRRFRVEDPSFVFWPGSGRAFVQIVLTARVPVPREELERLIEGPGLSPVVMATPEEIRQRQSEWAAQNFAAVVRVDIPVRQENGQWVSAVPVTLRTHPALTLHLVDVQGHWIEASLAWLDE